MRKALGLLTMCTILTALTATAAYAAPEAEDVPAAMPAGTVYAVGQSADDSAVAVTVVDYAFDGSEEAGSGAAIDGGSRYYYGAQITGVSSGAAIDGADCVYFGASSGSIPLYNSRGTVSGIVWGDGRATSVDCAVGLLLTGDVSGGVVVEDGSSFTCSEAVIRCQAGGGAFRFHNAKLHSDAGVLLEMEPDAGASSVCYANGSYSGDHINASSAALSIAVERGALLFGDTAQTGGPIHLCVEAGGVWVVSERSTVTSITVEDGGTVYGELLETGAGALILFPSDTALEPGTYSAEPLTEKLPLGHGPAAPAQDAGPEAAEEQDAEPAGDDPDALRAKALFPLTTPDASDADDAPDASGAQMPEEIEKAEEAEEAEITDEPEPDPDARRARSLFPLSPDASDPDDAEDTDDETIRSSIADGVGLALPDIDIIPTGALPPSMELAAQLSWRSADRPAVAAQLKTGAKTHSFLPEALDNRALILYNPYCCSAA